MFAIRSIRRISSIYQQFSKFNAIPSSSSIHASRSYRFAESASSNEHTDERPGSSSGNEKSKRTATGDRKQRRTTTDDSPATSLVKFGTMFEKVPAEQKNKENFQKAIGLFLERNVHRRGQVEFIYAALRHMKEFGVLRDLDTYKKLLDIFPKGPMIAENFLQYAMKHYPKHQDCCVDVLDQMEYYFCYPDKEVFNMVKNIFGDNSLAMIKVRRMFYWMPKMRYANPYRLPDPLPSAPNELAKLAIKKMCRDPANELYEWYTQALQDGPAEKTWIVCGQSCHQRELIDQHPESKPLYVDGPFREWLFTESVSYFALIADADPNKFYDDIDPDEPETEEEWADWDTKFSCEFPKSRKAIMEAPTIHEQDDGTILSIAVTGSSSKESLVSWIQHLQKLNPKLAKIPVVFRMAHGIGDLIVPKEEKKDGEKEVLKTSSNS